MRTGKAASKDPRLLIRIVEAVAVVCLHTFLRTDYTRILQHFGLLEAESQAFGSDRTSAICHNMHGERMTKTSNLELVFRNVEHEVISKINIEYEGLQGHLKNWLKIKKSCSNAEALTKLLSKFIDGNQSQGVSWH